MPASPRQSKRDRFEKRQFCKTKIQFSPRRAGLRTEALQFVGVTRGSLLSFRGRGEDLYGCQLLPVAAPCGP